LCINLTSGMTQTIHLTNVDQWKEAPAVTETRVSDRFRMFHPDHCRERQETLTKL